jgi:hypothetical protein
MSLVHVASFESKKGDRVDVMRGHDEHTRALLNDGVSHPGNRRTLGAKDERRFLDEVFPGWVEEKGGKYLYTAQTDDKLAGVFWVGAGTFPAVRYPNSPIAPPYTAGFRSAYNAPEGGTFEGRGVAKRLAIAGLADVMQLTKEGGPKGLPPVGDVGAWIETDTDNGNGIALYEHLANTGRNEDPRGFVRVGDCLPEPEAGKVPERERAGMVITPDTLAYLASVSNSFVEFQPAT